MSKTRTKLTALWGLLLVTPSAALSQETRPFKVEPEAESAPVTPVSGPPQVGACCLLDGTCLILPEFVCVVGFFGEYQGDGSDCGPLLIVAEECNEPFESIFGTGMEAPNASNMDDDGDVVPIGFTFDFFDFPHETIGVSSNGYLSFGPTLGDFTNDLIPQETEPNDLIAPYWDDWSPNQAGVVQYETRGPVGDRRFIAQWTGVPHFSSGGSSTFQAVLFEADNCIEFHYGDELVFDTPTIGVEDPTGTFGLGIIGEPSPGGCLRLCIQQTDSPCAQTKFTKWSQLPHASGQGSNVASDLDLQTLDKQPLDEPGPGPNWVTADDFQSDGRPITWVRWWGAYLNIFFQPGFDPVAAPSQRSREFTPPPTEPSASWSQVDSAAALASKRLLPALQSAGAGDGGAMQLGGCALECPAGGVVEGEMCGDDTNGGCNSTPPVFTAAACGQTFCGSAWGDGGSRDTDWYLVTHPGGVISGTLTAQFPGVVFIVDGIAACAPVVVGETGTSEECMPGTAEADLPAGEYVVFVATGAFEGVPCGTANDYLVEIDCGPCNENAGDCYQDNGTPGCDDPECCALICDIDPFCCDVTWDSICADGAFEFCAGTDVDGWLVSFHTDLRADDNPAGDFSQPGDLLGLYFCSAGNVALFPTGVFGWDDREIFQYLTRLEYCCLLHSFEDPRAPGSFPAQDEAFYEVNGLRYWLDLQAVVGYTYNEACDVVETPNRAQDHFWGWHTSPDQWNDESALGYIVMGKADAWLYPEWFPVGPLPPDIDHPDQAFELLTSENTCPWDCDGSNDGRVTILDLLAVIAGWGMPGLCDTNMDGNVTIVDLLAVIANYGHCAGCACPEAAYDEREVCGADVNGGCNSTPPMFTEAFCGDTFCGTAWADGGMRDTDWYLVELPDPDGNGVQEISGTLESEFPGLAFIVDGIAACAPVVVGDFGCADNCSNIAQARATLAAPGSYVVFVATGTCDGGGVFEGYPCGSGNEYHVSIACAAGIPFECGPDAGDCCTPNGTVGCNDADCCAAVCAIDPFCCGTEWDSICADEAAVEPVCPCAASSGGSGPADRPQPNLSSSVADMTR